MRPVLVTGRTGQVARSLAALRTDAFRIVAVGRPTLDLTDAELIAMMMDRIKPGAVVNAAAYTSVEQAESNEAIAFAVNRDGAEAVASAAAERSIPVIHLSTDYVFSGDKPTPYTELDQPGPRTAYGRSKLAGEHAVAAANPRHVILRTA